MNLNLVLSTIHALNYQKQETKMSDGEKKAVKAKKPVKPAEHPAYAEMIVTAITTLKERNGSSGQAIKKYIKANFKVKDNADLFIKGGLRKGVEKGTLTQVKGNGASGSFKVAKVEKPKPKKKPAAKKPAAKKPAAKKPAAKKAAAKKTPKKAAKKPAAKKPAAKKTPKKAAKKPAAKKPAAKKVKTPKKKTAKK